MSKGAGAVEVDGNASFPVLANISTRLPVQTGDNVLIAGTIVLDRPSQRSYSRNWPVDGVPGKLADPTLELRDGAVL